MSKGGPDPIKRLLITRKKGTRMREKGQTFERIYGLAKTMGSPSGPDLPSVQKGPLIRERAEGKETEKKKTPQGYERSSRKLAHKRRHIADEGGTPAVFEGENLYRSWGGRK